MPHYRAADGPARDWRLFALDARGGTEMLTPLREAVGLLTDGERDRVIVLVTDGQVGNEDQLLRELTASLSGIRVHTIGIDRAVNSGFLTRLAGAGGGRCELVESEDRLDEAAARIHHRIAAPLLTGVRLSGAGIVGDTVAPARLPDLFSGVPLVITGRWRGETTGNVTVTGRTPDGRDWTADVPVTRVDNQALTSVWARAHLRDLEDRYVVGEPLEERIVATSIRFGVLCRFTAFVAIDSRVVTDGGTPHRVVQPVEPVSGWDMLNEPRQRFAAAAPMAATAAMVTPMGSARPTGMAAGGLQSEATVGAMDLEGAPGRAGPIGAFAAEGHAFAVKSAARFKRGPNSLAAARAQAAEEARRLRANENATERERRSMLADLGSRMEALAAHLEVRGHADEAAPLRELANDLRDCDIPQPDTTARLARLWQRALDVLDAFAGNTPPGGQDGGEGGGLGAGGSGTAGPGRRGGAFWKRG